MVLEKLKPPLEMKITLQHLIDVASNLNLLQKNSFGTRKAKSGNSNIPELVFTNNHDLVSNIYGERSELTDHDYIICETSHNFNIDKDEQIETADTNLSYNHEKTVWDTVKGKFRNVNWIDTLNSYTNSEDKVKSFLEIVSQVVDENCIKFKQTRGNFNKIIPRERRILLRSKKKLKNKKSKIEDEILLID